MNIEEFLKTSVESMDYCFMGHEFGSEGKRKVLRVYIEKKDPQERVSLSDCEKVSRSISQAFDQEDPTEGPYVLEVSSPGIYRALKSIDDYRRFVGKQIRAVFRKPPACIKDNVAIANIYGVNGSVVTLGIEGSNAEVPFEDIARANLEPKL
ncbi:ribosome maturation factor RimP [Elusimicrobiota bacterium]